MRNKKINITEKVMKKIKNEKITMRPKWYFWLGSAVLFIAIVSLMIVTVFLISLVTFSLRNRGGPMAIVRYQQIVSNFPWWAVVVSILGLISGITLLKKYDFSYNFVGIPESYAFFDKIVSKVCCIGKSAFCSFIHPVFSYFHCSYHISKYR